MKTENKKEKPEGYNMLSSEPKEETEVKPYTGEGYNMSMKPNGTNE